MAGIAIGDVTNKLNNVEDSHVLPVSSGAREPQVVEIGKLKEHILSELTDVAFSGSYDDLDNTPTIPTVPSNVSAFNNDAGYITGYTETDPTVPSWAKASTKPSYTASEVGALPDDTQLFSGDYNDLTNKPTIPSAVTESTVSGWGFTKNSGTVTYTEDT